MLLLLACATALQDATPYVDSPRVLAAQVEPAEAEEGDPVTLTALYAGSSGQLDAADLDWAYCAAQKPLAELGPVATSCVDAASEDLVPIASGISVAATLPDDACSLFGPNPPPPTDGESGGRPTDPDVTGGFYQPALAFDGDTATLVQARVRCGLANVSQDDYILWNSRYHNNYNPEVGLVVPASVGAGEVVSLTASWPDCPEVGVCGDGICSGDEDLELCAEDCEDPVGCGGAETYVVFDGVLGAHREALSAAWFATGGAFGDARNGRASDELDTSVDNTWTAPIEAGTAWIGVVLRDERGGVDFAGAWVDVE